jgi:hypothetical protein
MRNIRGCVPARKAPVDRVDPSALGQAAKRGAIETIGRVQPNCSEVPCLAVVARRADVNTCRNRCAALMHLERARPTGDAFDLEALNLCERVPYAGSTVKQRHRATMTRHRLGHVTRAQRRSFQRKAVLSQVHPEVSSGSSVMSSFDLLRGTDIDEDADANNDSRGSIR